MTSGSWLDGSVPGMRFKLLPPVGYDATKGPYPLVFYFHQLDLGIPSNWATLSVQLNTWFNPGAVRDNFPCFVLAPLLDQTNDRGGTKINFGGVSAGNNAGRDAALACLAQVCAGYPVDTNKIVVTGNSLGGIATWELIAARPDLFAAAMPLAGASYARDPVATANALRNKPIWAIHGGGDKSVPLAWDRAIASTMKALGSTSFRYTEDPARSHDVWDYYYIKPEVWAWAFAQRLSGAVQPPVVPPPPPFVRAGPTSADNTLVVGGSSLIDAGGHAWTISLDGRVATDGVADASTANVVALAWVGGVVWQQNLAGKWYAAKDGTWLPGTMTSPLPQPPPVPGTSFSISGGQIHRPDGTVFAPAVGININDWQMGVVAPDDRCEPLLKYFPGLTIVRVACRKYNEPDYYRDFITRMSAKKIVMKFEDHTGISKPPYVGAQLAAEVKWYTDLAAAFADNPYVWFGGFNEPGDGKNLPGIAAQNLAIYTGIRSTGSKTIVALSLPSGGNRGLVGPYGRGYDGSVMGGLDMVKSLTNIIFDLHNYGWLSDFSTDPAVIRATLLGIPPAPTGTGAAAAQLWLSADGVVPIMIGEFGNSTTGKGIDANGILLCKVTAACAKEGKIAGWQAWHWNAAGDAYEDQLVSDAGNLTSFGTLIAGLIVDATADVVTPPPPPSPLIQLRADITALSARLTALGG